MSAQNKPLKLTDAEWAEHEDLMRRIAPMTRRLLELQEKGGFKVYTVTDLPK